MGAERERERAERREESAVRHQQGDSVGEVVPVAVANGAAGGKEEKNLIRPGRTPPNWRPGSLPDTWQYES